MALRSRVLSTLIASVALATSGGLHAESPTSRMDAMQALGLESLTGRMPTYYSPGAQDRARYLQSLLGGEIEYYSQQFQVRFAPITMAVLEPKQWSQVAGGDPYGMPSVGDAHPYVFVMPAKWESVTWMPFPKRAAVPAALLKRALVSGRTWQQVKFEGCDGIGSHEIGHAVIKQLGIDAQTHWFNELLASYVGYAYLKAKHPPQALASEIFWIQGLDAPHPITTLDDFDTRYDELEQQHPGNYGWYQLAFDQQVIKVFRRDGFEFLRSVRAAFPRGGPKLTTAQVLDKLETLSAGWKGWAAQVEAGDIKPVALSTP